jgi:hypothetical protein
MILLCNPHSQDLTAIHQILCSSDFLRVPNIISKVPTNLKIESEDFGQQSSAPKPTEDQKHKGSILKVPTAYRFQSQRDLL